MDSRPILYGIIGFILGGFVVGIAVSAATLSENKPTDTMNMSMSSMSDRLRSKTGDDFDKEFISEMITHHQGAVAMAQRATTQAKHPEVKQLASDIITAQSQQIAQLQTWQAQWGYTK